RVADHRRIARGGDLRRLCPRGERNGDGQRGERDSAHVGAGGQGDVKHHGRAGRGQSVGATPSSGGSSSAVASCTRRWRENAKSVSSAVEKIAVHAMRCPSAVASALDGRSGSPRVASARKRLPWNAMLIITPDHTDRVRYTE